METINSRWELTIRASLSGLFTKRNIRKKVAYIKCTKYVTNASFHTRHAQDIQIARGFYLLRMLQMSQLTLCTFVISSLDSNVNIRMIMICANVYIALLMRKFRVRIFLNVNTEKIQMRWHLHVLKSPLSNSHQNRGFHCFVFKLFLLNWKKKLLFHLAEMIQLNFLQRQLT